MTTRPCINCGHDVEESAFTKSNDKGEVEVIRELRHVQIIPNEGVPKDIPIKIGSRRCKVLVQIIQDEPPSPCNCVSAQ